MALELVGSVFTGITSTYSLAFNTVHPVFYGYVPYWSIILTALFLSPITVILPQVLKGTLTWPRKKDIPNVWTISGKRYDLTPFLKEHPGGAHVLERARGSECTGLFESYHIFVSRDTLFQMMAKYELHDGVEADKPAMVYHDAFYGELKQMVRDHFRGKGKAAHKMTTPHLCLCFAAWVLMHCLNYHMITNNAIWCIPPIGCLAWYMTGNVMHDASHNALVPQKWLNRLMSVAAFPYGINQGGWQIQHVLSHHVFVNEEKDVDLYHYDPMMTTSVPHAGKINWFLHSLRVAWLCSSAVAHLCIVVPYGLLVGHVDPAHGHRMYDRMENIEYLRAILRGQLILEVICQFLYFYTIYRLQGFIPGMLFWMCVQVIAGYLFSFFTQVSHLQEECFLDPKRKDELSFAKRQIFSSLDFAPESFFWGHVSGGLNTQAIHHCFPSVSAMHLRDMAPQFRIICKKNGVPYKEAPSLRSFVWGCFSFANL